MSLEMSSKETRRCEVLKRLCAGKISQQVAAEELHLTTRQVRRLQRAFGAGGKRALFSRRCGRPSNHQLAPKLKRSVVALIEAHYPDFGPTLAHEKLTEQHGLRLCRESVRRLMIASGLWKPRKVRRLALHALRERRARFGELIQIDGSPHDWFEGRAPPCTLIVFVDDATSRLQQLHFAPAETTFAYFHVVRDYIEQFGKPTAFYSDKLGVFRVNQPYLSEDAGQTQFGRAMAELGIELICANSPQAKGRVERANQTLQDRLVKELRLRAISDLTTANAFLPDFALAYNRRFAVTPRSDQDAHRPLLKHEDLERILTLQTQHTLSKNLTLQHERVLYQITAAMSAYRLRHQKVMVRENEAREVSIEFQGRPLPYRIYHRAPRQGAVLTAKEVHSPLATAAFAPNANASDSIRSGTRTRVVYKNAGNVTATQRPVAHARYIPPPDAPWRKKIHADVKEALRKKAARPQVCTNAG